MPSQGRDNGSPRRAVTVVGAFLLGTVASVRVGGDRAVAGASGRAPAPARGAGRDHGTGWGRAAAAGGGGAAGATRERLEFREYVVARRGALLRAAYTLTRNRADAEDLVQAALAKTYQAWDRIENEGALDGYVRRAIVNAHISWWRRRRLEEYPTDDLPETAVADHSGDSALQDTLRRALDRLPSRMREAVVLRYYEDMSEAEVADALGVSQGTVKSTLSRAVAKLRIDADLQEG